MNIFLDLFAAVVVSFSVALVTMPIMATWLWLVDIVMVRLLDS